MMNKINNILIGLLWLLAVTLGSTFWFNTMFGFNIFSIQHWQHLAYVQATGQTVKPTFYISVVIAVLLAMFGLYKLLQPRFRKTVLQLSDNPMPEHQGTSPQMPAIQQTQQYENTASASTTSQMSTTDNNSPDTGITSTADRPPRLNIPTITRTETVPRVPLAAAQITHKNPETEYADIRNIFESAGYVFKGMPKIKNVQIATVAIGTGEILWIGAVDVKNSDMQRAVQTLSGVFTDTLEDIEIHIRAFVIAAPDAANAPSDILQFASVEDLRNYINDVPNTPPDADEADNFDAYSGYIGTVMDYIGKI